MWQRRRRRVAQLREELCCPSCEYSLRGLPGDVATEGALLWIQHWGDDCSPR